MPNVLRQLSDQLAAGPGLVERVGIEATLEHALGGVGQQHQPTRPAPVEQLLELGQPRRAEVLRLVDDDDVEAVGDRRPVAVQVSDGDGVPPRAVGVVRHVERRHAVERPGHAVERADGEQVVGRQPVDEDGAERVVVAGQQDAFAPRRRRGGPTPWRGASCHSRRRR